MIIKLQKLKVNWKRKLEVGRDLNAHPASVSGFLLVPLSLVILEIVRREELAFVSFSYFPC